MNHFVPSASASGGNPSPFAFMNDSKFVLAGCMLMLNLGAKYIANDLGEMQMKFFDTDLAKRFVMFSLFFMGTRDVVMALTLTLAFSLLVFGFLNDNSNLTLISSPENIEKRVEDYFRKV
jgi:flagellar biosynthesis protein FlhB